MLLLLSTMAFAADSPEIRAAKKAQKKCDAGTGSACMELADLYESGLARLAADVGPVELWQRACTLGNADGCNRLSAATAAPAASKGVAGTEAACLADASTAVQTCLDMGTRLAAAARDTASRDRARALLDAVCTAAPKAGCAPLAQFLSSDAEAAASAMTRGCEGGVGPLCVALGRHLDQSDQTEALRRFEQGCSLGDEHACAEVGAVYYLGKGIATNKSRAKEMWQAQCDRGVAEQCAALESLKAAPQDFEPKTRW